MSPDEYIEEISRRLRADGAEVTTESIGDLTTLVGYRSQFRLRWMATRLHLFTVVGSVPWVTAAELERFSNDALDYAISRKGQFRGLQNGVAVIPVLVGERIDPDAATFATATLVRRFSAFAWPAAVDLSTQHVYQHQRDVVLGGIYAGWMRQQTAIALTEPVAS
jgi:hypothetical protein